MKRALRVVACASTALLLAGASALPLQAAAFSLKNGDVGWDGPGLGSATLTYWIEDTPDLENENDIIALALEQWANVASVHFVETDTPGLSRSLDFHFGFDPNAPNGLETDGPFGNLAYAFFPDDLNSEPLAGDVYFDEAELWTAGLEAPGSCSTLGCDLYFVAMHEIGHTLGLEHPEDPYDPPSIMTQFFTPTTGPELGFGAYGGLLADDVAGIQSIYASAPGSVTPLPTPVPEPSSGLLGSLGLAAIALLRRRRSLD